MKPSADTSLEISLIRDDLPFRLQRRVGLIPERGLGTARRALFFALLTWLPIVLWAGYMHRILPGTVDEPLLRHFGVHVRFLIAVPLFILGEGMLHKLSTTLIPYFLTSGLVRETQRQEFVDIIGHILRLRNRTLPWVAIAGIVLAITVLEPASAESHLGHEVSWAEEGAPGRLGFGGWWFMYVSRPVFSALLAAWLWRLVLVFLLLRRISRLDLALVPTHPDGAGGLGFLERLPTAFSLFSFAVSAVLSSRLAHSVVYHGVGVQSLKGVFAVFLIVILAICIAPLLSFIGPLAAAKRQALLEYGALIGEHGRLVRRRWILGETDLDDRVLQAPELGPVADTLTLYEAVKKMRVAPVGKPALLAVAVPALIPILGVLSIQIPIKDLLKQIVGTLL